MIQRQCYFLCYVLITLGCNDEEFSRSRPLAPTGLYAKWVSPTQIQLSWDDVSDNEQGFTIEHSLPLGIFGEIATVPANTTSYLDEGLFPDTEYFYKVSSFNSEGSATSNIVSVSTPKKPVPVQVTIEIAKIGTASALGIVSFNSDAFPEVFSCGLVWSTSPHPELYKDSQAFNFTNTSPSICVIGPLAPSTKYYVIPFANREPLETIVGNEISFTTSSESMFRPGGGVTDVEGNNYKTVIIGDQEWMAENLRTSTYSNGEKIDAVTDGEQWAQLTSAAWCHYNNDPQFDQVQGKMYNWYAATNPRNVCPSGWQVPKSSQWIELQDYLGGAYLAGVRLKSPLSSWEQPDLSTNESGFSAVPSGICLPCEGQSAKAIWWSTTKAPPYEQQLSDEAYVVSVYAGSGSSATFSYAVNAGISIRCKKKN